jgi:hypothetical protein
VDVDATLVFPISITLSQVGFREGYADRFGVGLRAFPGRMLDVILFMSIKSRWFMLMSGCLSDLSLR